MTTTARISEGLGAALLATVLGALACGPVERTMLLYEPESDGARAIWSVDFVQEFTVPENYRYRTEEYGSPVADPSRGLVYVGSRDGMLVAFDDREGEFAWELDVGGGLSSVPVLAVVDPEQGLGHAAAPSERPNWMLTGTDDGALVAIDLDTREVRWRATVAAAAITGVAWAIYTQSTVLAVHTEQLRALTEFQNRGTRFTAAEGAVHAQRILSIESHQRDHEQDAKVGYGRIRALEAITARCTERQDNLVTRIGNIERWAHSHRNGMQEFSE